MKTKILLLIPILLFIHSLKSQSWDWKKSYSGGTLLADQANNVYVFTDRRISYDWPQPTPFSIKKLDAAGNIIWSKTVSGLEFSAYKINSDNNLIILGNLSAPTTIDNFTISPLGSKSFFILKISSSGIVLDADVYGSNKTTFAKDLFITDNGDYLICGGYQGTFNVNGYNINSADTFTNAFLLRLDSSLNVLWSETSSFTSYGEYAAFNEVIQADNGNYYATINMVAGLANFKGYTFQYSGQYLLRLDTSHSVVWSKYLDYAAESFSYFSDLKIAGDTIFMKEYYHPPHGGGSNSLHIWHPDGTTYGFGLGDADGAGYDISNGRIYYVRSFNSPEDSTDTSHFVLGVATFDGVKQFEKIISSAQVCWASDLIYTADNQIYVTAEESFNAAFVAKLTLGPVNGLSEINMQTDISLFPNPATDFVKIQSSSGMKQSIEFINELGQSVLYREFDKSTDHCINVSKLPRGAYFVRIISNSHAEVKRVILR